MNVLYSGSEKKIFFDVFRRAGVQHCLLSYLELHKTGMAEKIVSSRKRAFPDIKLFVHSGLVDAGESDFAESLELHGSTLESIRDGYAEFVAAVAPYVDGVFDFDSHASKVAAGRFLWGGIDGVHPNIIPTWVPAFQSTDELVDLARSSKTVAVLSTDDLSLASPVLRSYLTRPHMRKLPTPDTFENMARIVASADLSTWPAPLKNREVFFYRAGKLRRESLDNPPEHLSEFVRRHGLSENMVFSKTDAMAEVRGKTVVTRWQDLYFTCLFNVVLSEPVVKSSQPPFWERRLPEYPSFDKVVVTKARAALQSMRLPVDPDEAQFVAWWLSLLHRGDEQTFSRIKSEVKESYARVFGADAPSLNEPFDSIRVNACLRSVPSIEPPKIRSSADFRPYVPLPRPRNDLPVFEGPAEMPEF